MEKIQEPKCIYCGKGASDGVKLSESDIIPQALTNRRLINKYVCAINHNNKFSDEFESTVIENLSIIRNHLAMFGKGKKLPMYKSKCNIGDISVYKNVSNREEILNGKILSGTTKNKQKIKFGDIEHLKAMSSFDPKNCIEINLNDYKITEEVEFSISTLFSNEGLRMAAKVGYEWFCREKNIQNYYPEYKDIVSFIENGTSQQSIVEVVINTDLYETVNSQIDVGGHALAIVYSSDGNIYVLFSFLGIIIYKIKIKHSIITFLNRQTITFLGLRCDGFVINDIKISLSTDYLHDTSTNPENALKIMSKYIQEKVQQLLNTQLFTLSNFKFVIDDITHILHDKDEKNRYNNLIGYGNERTLSALYILYFLGEHKKTYNNLLSFNSNLKIIFNVDDKIKLTTPLNELLAPLYNKDNFIDIVQSGIKIFNDAFKKENNC